MSVFTIKDFQRVGAIRHLLPDWFASGICTDSRTVKNGDAFVALSGGRFDGHDFIPQVLEKGAAACIVSEIWYDRYGHRFSNQPFIVVEDTLKALQQLACKHRQSYDCSVIAVTGTNGKTTCKEMLGAVLSTTFDIVTTQGNYNNEIGVPLTLLQIRDDTEIAVVEMGADHPGDIGKLCDIALPDCGVITNVGKAHLQYFGTIERIAATKLELFNHLLSDGVRYINADDPLLSPHQEIGKACYTFGYEQPADYRGQVLSVNDGGCACLRLSGPDQDAVEIQLQTPGLHQRYNALIAASIGWSLGIPGEAVVNALENYRPLSNRLSIRRIKNLTILDDTYNANPDSMKAAVETLLQIKSPGRKICVLGDMLELGESAGLEHVRLGQWLRGQNLSAVFLYGPLTKKTEEPAQPPVLIRHFENKEELIAELNRYVKDEDVILIKGSRGMRMEDVVQSITG